MTFRSLPFFVGAREPCEGFRNMDEARGTGAAAPPADAR
jgi:hypothetical protein